MIDFSVVNDSDVSLQASPTVMKVIGCGGGVVKRKENVDVMRDAGYVVYLETTVDEAVQRIPNTDSRPLFNDLDSTRALLAERIPLYEAAADIKVDTVGLTTAEVAQVVKDALEEASVLTSDG